METKARHSPGFLRFHLERATGFDTSGYLLSLRSLGVIGCANHRIRLDMRLADRERHESRGLLANFRLVDFDRLFHITPMVFASFCRDDMWKPVAAGERHFAAVE